MTGQAPGMPPAFWRGLVIGLFLSAAIAWLAVVAWKIVLWLA